MKWQLPKAARYPLFLGGFVSMIAGGLGARLAGGGAEMAAGFGGVGIVLLALSVALK
ncbi:MAG: hypothetical protein JRN39_01835 [Nitrososphaerota archaeon]|nr:hypothetical protein [Nitrososphaerota archaeon]